MILRSIIIGSCNKRGVANSKVLYVFRNMERHLPQLQKLCWICSNPVVKKKSCYFIASEFKDVILRTFSHELETDLEDVHPKLLCMQCKENYAELKSQVTRKS